MRFVTFRIVPADGGLHPIEARLHAEPDITPVALHHFNVLGDGTVVFLTEYEGDRERLAVTADHPDLVSRDVSDGESEDSFYVYSRVRVNDTVAQLFDILESHELVLDAPMEYTPDGGLRITVIGELETFQAAVPDLPADIETHLERTGEYRPDGDQLYSLLTERQRETLQVAVELGYYEVPRRATYEDLAAELGIAAGTVGEHLRKIEATVLREILP